MRGKTLFAVAGGAFALFAAGCGGSTTGAGGDASSLAPANSIAFVAIDTDLGSDQWKAIDQLTSKFPIKAKAIKQIEQSLSKQGISVDKDVKPALGPELDVAVLEVNGNYDAVAMTQPNDEQKFDALLQKLDASSHDGSKTLHEKVGDWTVFSDKQAAIDAAKQASNGRSLSTVSSFNDAMDAVSADAVAKFYVDGAELTKLFPAGQMLAAATTPKLDWFAGRLTASSNTLEFAGAGKGSGVAAQTPYHPQLLADVPSGALVFVSWKNAAQNLGQATASPGMGVFLQQFQQSLGVRFQDLLPLLRGEGALWLAPAGGIPQFALELQESNDAQARATLRKLAAGIARTTHEKLTTQSVAGQTVPVLSVGPVKLMFVVAKGRAIVTDSAETLDSSGPRLADDPSFKEALKNAGAPSETTGLVYANLKDLVPFATGLAGVAGATVPPEVRANLEPLRYFVEYGTVSDRLARTKVYVETR